MTYTYCEQPDRVLDVFDGTHKIGIIKKVMRGWRFLIIGQRHVPTPVLHSRTAVQDWLEFTKGDIKVPYEAPKKGNTH